jgi:hypothetical protein
VYLAAIFLASLTRDHVWLMLAVVALFPVVLLALLLITSGLEGRVVGSGERPGARD